VLNQCEAHFWHHVAARKHKETKDGCHIFITPPKACWDQL